MTLVPGLRIGHASDPVARTGCTVVLGPFRGAAQVLGLATGTRELDALRVLHLVPRIDAILFTGGSAFGLAAADGVVAWLEERGQGFATPAARVPIVPAAVIYDLGVGSALRRPDAAMGRAACDAASGTGVGEGAVGAGTGATVGKLLGPASAARGGVGWHASRGPDCVVGALAVVNAIGDVRDGDGRIIAGARDEDGRFADAARLLREGRLPQPPVAASPGANTTLALIATDAPVSRPGLATLASMAAAAFARRIAPVFTPFDGDLTFAVSTAPEPREVPPPELLALGALAAEALEIAIERAVTV